MWLIKWPLGHIAASRGRMSGSGPCTSPGIPVASRRAFRRPGVLAHPGHRPNARIFPVLLPPDARRQSPSCTGESWDRVAQGPTSSALRPFSCRSRSRGRVISANASSTFLSSDLFLSAPRRGRLRQPRAALVRRLSVVAPSGRQMATSACERHTQAAHPCRDPTTRMVAVRDFDATTALLHGWLHRGGV